MKVSIITVTYNSAHTLHRTLLSIYNQTYSDIEHIIVDGESTDETRKIIHDFSVRHPNLRYISEKDSGIYDAINKGIQMATGDIIGLLNSDDELASPHSIAHVAEYIKTTKADLLYGDLVYCRFDDINNTPPHTIRYWKSNTFKEHDLAYGWMPPHPTVYCRRQVFERIGLYKTDFRISADYEFILRVFSDSTIKKVYLPEVIVRMRTGGISNRSLRMLLLKSKEDIRALRLNRHKPWLTIICKNLRKVHQFFNK